MDAKRCNKQYLLVYLQTQSHLIPPKQCQNSHCCLQMFVPAFFVLKSQNILFLILFQQEKSRLGMHVAVISESM